MQRRSPTLEERLMPCEACGYPISERHHSMPIEHYGENDNTKPMCANCHELYHLAYDALLNDSDRGKQLVLAVIKSSEERRDYCQKIIVDAAEDILAHVDHGVIEARHFMWRRIWDVFGFAVYVFNANVLDIQGDEVKIETPPGFAEQLGLNEEIELNLRKRVRTTMSETDKTKQ